VILKLHVNLNLWWWPYHEVRTTLKPIRLEVADHQGSCFPPWLSISLPLCWITLFHGAEFVLLHESCSPENFG
jgi:hypothetical protein